MNNSVAILATLTLWSLTQQTASRLPQGIALMIQECSSRVDWALKLNGAAFVGCLAMYPLIAAKITQDLDFARRLRLYDAMQPPGDVWSLQLNRPPDLLPVLHGRHRPGLELPWRQGVDILWRDQGLEIGRFSVSSTADLVGLWSDVIRGIFRAYPFFRSS